VIVLPVAAVTMQVLRFFLPVLLLILGLQAAIPPVPAPRPVELPRGARYLTADGAIGVVGYNDMQEMMQALTDRFAADHPGFKFALTLKGTRTGPPALAQGTTAFAPAAPCACP